MSEWKPIESAPKDGTAVLLGNSRSVVVGKFSSRNPYSDPPLSPAWMCGRTKLKYKMTHWMALPEPPNAKQE